PCQRVLYNFIFLRLWQLYSVQLIPGNYIIINAEIGKWVWPLEHHPDFKPNKNRVHFHYIFIVQEYLPFCGSAGNQFMHTVYATQKCRLTTTRRAHNSYYMIAGYFNVHIFHNVIVTK